MTRAVKRPVSMGTSVVPIAGRLYRVTPTTSAEAVATRPGAVRAAAYVAIASGILSVFGGYLVATKPVPAVGDGRLLGLVFLTMGALTGVAALLTALWVRRRRQAPAAWRQPPEPAVGSLEPSGVPRRALLRPLVPVVVGVAGVLVLCVVLLLAHSWLPASGGAGAVAAVVMVIASMVAALVGALVQWGVLVGLLAGLIGFLGNLALGPQRWEPTPPEGT